MGDVFVCGQVEEEMGVQKGSEEGERNVSGTKR